MTLHDNGDLSITNVTYGNAGKYACIVQNAYIGVYVIHNLDIECEFLVTSTYVPFLVINHFSCEYNHFLPRSS